MPPALPRVWRAALPAALLLAACGSPAPDCDPMLGLDRAGCAQVRKMRLPASLPPARGNAYASSEDAARLGFRLFFRSDLGRGVACATCHDPSFSFCDRRTVSRGLASGTRNAPTILNAARLHVIFWDGRADSVWSQPLFAIENPIEMGSTRLEMAHYVAGDPLLKGYYEATFGPMPNLGGLPKAGKPGDPAFDALSAADQDLVNRIAANVGKAFEAYERKNSSGKAALDRYLDGESSAIIDEARRGLGVFVRRGCVSCHAGPMFTDESFHDAGFPSSQGSAPDLGAGAGVKVLRDNPFNLDGPYADPVTDPAFPSRDPSAATEGAFRTPSLRLLSETAPYGHNGVFPTLREVVDFHADQATDTERGQLAAFLRTLTGEQPPRPWNTWPSPQ